MAWLQFVPQYNREHHSLGHSYSLQKGESKSRRTRNVTHILWNIRGKWRWKFLPLFLERPEVASNVDPGCVLQTGLPMDWVLVSSCYRLSIPAEFICSRSPTLDTNHMCLLVLAFKHLFRLVPPLPTLGTIFLPFLFSPVPFLFVYSVLKTLPPEGCLNWPYRVPRTPLFHSSSTLYYLHLCLCPIVWYIHQRTSCGHLNEPPDWKKNYCHHLLRWMKIFLPLKPSKEGDFTLFLGLPFLCPVESII